MFAYLFAALALVASASASNGLDAPPVVVEMFSNIDAPSSRWAFNVEVPEVYYALKPSGIMEISFNFYGIIEEPIGADEFMEQRLAECAIFHSTSNDTLVDFFKCFMNQDHFPVAETDGQQCAEAVGIEWLILDGCYQSDQGLEVLKEAGVKYHSMKPPVATFPEYYINGYPRTQAYGDLMKWVCDAYTGTPPPECPA